jgi:segregation and condensation protein A
LTQAEYKIKLPVFEGPFDLLFHLIKKAEVDIWSISIAEITDQYLAYLHSMKELNLDIASEFLVMAATLLRLKSKLLLPRPAKTEEIEDEDELFEIHSAEELFLRLEEYRFYKEVAHYLQRCEEEQQKIYLRSTGGQKVMVFTQQDSVYTIWEGANHLSDIMNRFAEATKTEQFIPLFNAVEDFIIADKMNHIKNILAKSNNPLPMDKFVSGSGLWELIITFITLLEMARQKKIILLQERLFGPIFATLKKISVLEDSEHAEN